MQRVIGCPVGGARRWSHQSGLRGSMAELVRRAKAVEGPWSALRRMSRHSSADSVDLTTVWEEGLSGPLTNLAPELRLLGLENGSFRAELPLSRLPKGDLTVWLQGNRLVLITPGRGHGETLPLPRAYLELPVYVDTDTLRYELKRPLLGPEVLQVAAYMKGVMSLKRRSAPDILVNPVTLGRSEGGVTQVPKGRTLGTKVTAPSYHAALLLPQARTYRSNST